MTVQSLNENPVNLCDSCCESSTRYGYGLSDTGFCSRCGAFGEVTDCELLDYYFARGIFSEVVIWAYLPRLRTYPHRSVSNDDIEEHIRRLPKRKAAVWGATMGYSRVAMLEDTENCPD